ncbi:hypothetical protein POM88_018826 [Heracleum sosnowskyi]|uniref:Uncharacterized protein n=1 Tax=Heracleum sosnowskyi TaxID=360622 RepID=A0AAD8N0Q7_9APIA|nr:hypothetical protein POM88_018826 [Heracleum sosnowskyi]
MSEKATIALVMICVSLDGCFGDDIGLLQLWRACMTLLKFVLTDPEQNTFLHVAARYGQHNLTTYIAYEFSQLLTCRNHRGDSALHLATRAGQLMFCCELEKY